MITNLEAYPDATLASIVAIALAGVGCGRLRTGEVLVGITGASIARDLPMHLDRLARSLGPALGYDARALAVKHTMLPAYAPWIPSARAESVLRAMRGDGPTRPPSLLGAHACQTKPPRYLRYCPSCRAKELDMYQAAWWHRAHQLSGASHCAIHKCKLVVSQFPREGAWKSEYPLVENARGRPVDHEPCPWAYGIAEDVAWLLAHDLPSHGVEAIRSVYLRALEGRGLVAGRLERTEFLRQFFEAYGERYLRWAGLWFDRKSPYAWPAKLVVSAGVCHPPIRHLHLIRFLGYSVGSFFEEVARVEKLHPRQTRTVTTAAAEYLDACWQDPSYSIHQMSMELGISQNTVRTWASSIGLELPRFPTVAQKRLYLQRRQTKREAWLRIRNGKVSKRRRRILHWLSRNDTLWFAHHQRSRRAESSTPSAPWAFRDRDLLRQLPAAVRVVRAHRPYRRVCRGSIAAVMGVAGYLQKSDGRMPRFEAALARVTESWRQFALRRIKAIRCENPSLPRWRVRELASIGRPLPQDPEIRRALGYPVDSIYHGCHSY